MTLLLLLQDPWRSSPNHAWPFFLTPLQICAHLYTVNPQTKEEAIELAKGITDSVGDKSPGDVGLFVPFPFIETVQKIAGDKFVVGAEVRKRWMDGLGVYVSRRCTGSYSHFLIAPTNEYDRGHYYSR